MDFFEMKRPTIPDLAKAAGVSISTVNRVLAEPETVRSSTRTRVLAAAEEIGFYGLGTIKHAAKAPEIVHRLGILLQRRERRFYRLLGDSITHAAEAYPGGNIELTVEYRT
jgi:LacI family transcriptional regulator